MILSWYTEYSEAKNLGEIAMNGRCWMSGSSDKQEMWVCAWFESVREIRHDDKLYFLVSIWTKQFLQKQFDLDHILNYKTRLWI